LQNQDYILYKGSHNSEFRYNSEAQRQQTTFGTKLGSPSVRCSAV